MKIKVYPSLLAADFGNLEQGVKDADQAGGDAIHLDIMDGHFVPNLSMGPDVVAMAKRATNLPLNVHLMMTNPDEHINNFAEAGADSLLIHIEAQCDVLDVLDRLQQLGIRRGITLNPDTPAKMIAPVINEVDEVLCMSVHPGYGGQKFIGDVLPKIREVREMAKSAGKDNMDILVDGGINRATAMQCAAEGANVFIAGNSVYSAPDMTAEVSQIRKQASDSFTQ